MRDTDELVINGTLGESLKKIVRGSGIVFTGTLLGMTLAFLGKIIVIRYLTTSEFGLLSLGIVIIGIVGALASIGIPLGVTRYISYFRGQKDNERIWGTIFASLKITAEEINDLYDTSPLEEKMYRALKRRGINPERQLYVYLDSQTYCLDFCIFCQRANIDLECDGERYHNLPDAFWKDRLRNNQLASFGWYVLRFSSREIYHNRRDCLTVVKRTIHTLKGLKEVRRS